jgi:hypothetical protein
VHLRYQRGEDGDLGLQWIRRTRIDGDGWDAPEVPLGEESEHYVVRIRKDGVVLREIEIQTPAYHYGPQEQVSDGLTVPFTVEVAQVSATYGPGPSAVLQVPE